MREITMTIKLTKKILLKTLIAAVTVSSLGILLSGCSSDKKLDYQAIPKAPTVQEVRASLKSKIKKDEIKIVHVGQTIRLVIPSDYTFQPGSANLYKGQVKTLRQIARYISTYDQSDVRVRGFTAKGVDSKYLKVLSAKRAEVISHYLWGMGIKTQLIVASGLGEMNNVDINATIKGRFNNNRVEITFMYRQDMPLYD